MHGNQCIFFTCFGVLKLVVLWIERPPSLHVELRHFAFVKSDKGNFLSIWGPFECLSHGKFLLIHPVCSPVDDAVTFPIKGKLGRSVVGKIGYVQVVVLDKGYLIVVWGKGGVGDFFASHELLLLSRGQVYYIKNPFGGTAVDRLHIRSQKGFGFISIETVIRKCDA